MVLKSEAEYTAPTAVCRHPERWTAADADATEHEVLELITGLVRGLQPALAVEAGTYKGHGAAAIEIGLGEHGRLSSLDTEAHPLEVHVGDKVTVEQADAMTWTPPAPIDFAFIDAGTPEVRAAIFRHWYPHFSPNATVVIHDTTRGQMRIHITAWEKEAKCRAIYLPTPRGLAILQVTKPV